MQKINNLADLEIAIIQTEQKQAEEWSLLNDQILMVSNSLNPLQILKRSFKDIISPSQGKNDILSTVMGLSAGVISKALIIGSTHNPFKVLMGALLQMKVSNSVTKNAGTIGFVATNLLKMFGKKKASEPIQLPSNPLSEIF